LFVSLDDASRLNSVIVYTLFWKSYESGEISGVWMEKAMLDMG
jgi:hypothetical protein